MRVVLRGCLELPPQDALQRQQLAEQLAQRIGFGDELAAAAREARRELRLRTHRRIELERTVRARGEADRRRASRRRRYRDTPSTSSRSRERVASRINAACCGNALSSKPRTPRAMLRDGSRTRRHQAAGPRGRRYRRARDTASDARAAAARTTTARGKSPKSQRARPGAGAGAPARAFALRRSRCGRQCVALQRGEIAARARALRPSASTHGDAHAQVHGSALVERGVGRSQALPRAARAAASRAPPSHGLPRRARSRRRATTSRDRVRQRHELTPQLLRQRHAIGDELFRAANPERAIRAPRAASHRATLAAASA